MGATLEALRALQDVELQIVDIRRQLAAKERAVKRQHAKMHAAEETLATGRSDLKQTQAEMDTIDLDLKSRNTHLSKLRDNLNSVKTNREYAAVLADLNSQKADVTRLEQRAFQLLETVEAKKVTIREHEEALKLEQARLQNLNTQLEQARGSFAQRLGQLEAERTAATESIPAKALDLFERLSERYEGEVMAEVVRTHPRRDDFICDGCQMSLAAERANALMSRDEVVICDNCGRILYISPGT